MFGLAQKHSVGAIEDFGQLLLHNFRNNSLRRCEADTRSWRSRPGIGNHRYRVSDDREFTHIRMDVVPDGGLTRVRIFGEVPDETHDELALRWFNALTDAHAEWVGVSAGLDLAEAAKLAASGPLTQATHLPRGVTRDR